MQGIDRYYSRQLPDDACVTYLQQDGLSQQGPQDFVLERFWEEFNEVKAEILHW